MLIIKTLARSSNRLPEIAACFGKTHRRLGLSKISVGHHDRNLQITIRLLEQGICSKSIQIGAQFTQNPQASIMKLGLGRLEVDHQIVMGLPKADE